MNENVPQRLILLHFVRFVRVIRIDWPRLNDLEKPIKLNSLVSSAHTATLPHANTAHQLTI